MWRTLLVVVLGLFVVGCNNSGINNTPDGKDATPTPSAPADKTANEVGDGSQGNNTKTK